MNTPKVGSAAAPIVFLHIPKTAGQTVHSELSQLVGPEAVSPVRVHTQAAHGAAQLPAGYRLYSGHIDWDALDTLPKDRFVFTVLRDPRERIASFYFYLLREAQKQYADAQDAPERSGARMILKGSADEYFFGGDARWQTFVNDHYNNMYCSYLITRQIRGWSKLTGMSRPEIVQAALDAKTPITRIYSTDTLADLEADIAVHTGQSISVAKRYVNAGPDAGPDAPSTLRWPQLCARFERDSSVKRLTHFARLDQHLMKRLGLSDQAKI